MHPSISKKDQKSEERNAGHVCLILILKRNLNNLMLLFHKMEPYKRTFLESIIGLYFFSIKGKNRSERQKWDKKELEKAIKGSEEI